MPGGAVEAHAPAPVAGDAERAAPVVRELDVAQRREQLAHRGDEHRADPLVAVVAGVDPRPEVVRRAAAAERDATVGRALAVDDHVPGVVERRSVGEPDGVPLRAASARRSRPSASTRARASRWRSAIIAVYASVASTTTSARTVAAAS